MNGKNIFHELILSSGKIQMEDVFDFLKEMDMIFYVGAII